MDVVIYWLSLSIRHNLMCVRVMTVHFVVIGILKFWNQINGIILSYRECYLTSSEERRERKRKIIVWLVLEQFWIEENRKKIIFNLDFEAHFLCVHQIRWNFLRIHWKKKPHINSHQQTNHFYIFVETTIITD